MEKCRIGVLVSGGGTNLQSVIDACESGRLDAEVVYVASDREKAYALERAENHGISHGYFGRKRFEDKEERHRAILEALEVQKVDLVVLAGYLGILTGEFIKAFEGRILNIHPSLLPKFGGEGFYGEKVHEAVLAAGEMESGATVHFVNEGIDTGEILIQGKVEVSKEDTVESLQKKVLVVEHRILIDGIEQWIKGYGRKNRG